MKRPVGSEGGIVLSPDQAKPSAWRCWGQARGRAEKVTSFCAVKPPGCRPSRIARVISGGEKGQTQQQRYIGWAELLLHRDVGDASSGAHAELLLQVMRANQQFDQLGIRLAGDPGSQGCIDD